MNYYLRKATVADAEACIKFNNNCWRDTYASFINERVFTERESKNESRIQRLELAIADKKNSYWVAEFEGVIVGMLSFHITDRKGYQNYGEASFYISSNFQRQGLGKEFFNLCQKETKNRRNKGFVVTCFKLNTNAIDFYLKMGGEIIEETIIEFGGEKFIEVIIVFQNLEITPPN